MSGRRPGGFCGGRVRRSPSAGSFGTGGAHYGRGLPRLKGRPRPGVNQAGGGNPRPGSHPVGGRPTLSANFCAGRSFREPRSGGNREMEVN